jgi:uncharacterized protein involved in propanediol utilization
MRKSHGSRTSCNQPWKTKALKAAQLTIERYAPGTSVDLDLRSTIPEGVGAGSSTADCAATIRAVEELLGVPAAASAEALDLLFAAEGPCDPLLLLDDRATLLWGSRCGRLFRRYDAPLPEFHALGFVTDPGRMVSTVELAANQQQHPPTPSGMVDRRSRSTPLPYRRVGYSHPTGGRRRRRRGIVRAFGHGSGLALRSGHRQPIRTMPGGHEAT